MFNRFKKRRITTVAQVGYFDGVNGDLLNGWIYAGPEEYINYKIFCDDELIHEGIANQFREDLKSVDAKSDFAFQISMSEIGLFSKIDLLPSYTFRIESELGDTLINHQVDIPVFTIFNKDVINSSTIAFEKIKRYIKDSCLFDAQFYINKYSDIAKKGSDPLSHYILYGAAEGRWPNQFFDGPLFAKHYQSEFSETNQLCYYLLADKLHFTNFAEVFEQKWIRHSKSFREKCEKNLIANGSAGCFDDITSDCLSGWLYSGTNEHLGFKLFCDDKLIYQGVADQYDEDLKRINSKANFAFKVSLDDIGFYSDIVLKPSYTFRIESLLGDLVINHTTICSVFSVFNKDVLRTSSQAFEVIKRFIKKSLLFDSQFYISRYKDIKRKGSDPLSHFILYGAEEGRWPNRYFDSAMFNIKYQSGFLDTNSLFFYLLSDVTLFDELSSEFDVRLYLALNKDVKDAGVEPLWHYLTNGFDEGRTCNIKQFTLLGNVNYNNKNKVIPSISDLTTTIVVPVFNAFEETKECLESLVKYTDLTSNNVLVLDDASTDTRIKDLLNLYQNYPGMTIHFNDRNIGYTCNVNLGVALTKNDIVLLNSDTKVGPHWLRNLKIAAYTNTQIGTVTAVSNNAGAFSVPNSGTNELPEGLSTENMARLVSRSGCDQQIEVPTGNGFCLYIKRDVLDTLGTFDETLFPRGYGEENDFCMRVLRSGKINVVAPNTFVYHVRSASFKDDKAELIEAGLKNVKKLYPDYNNLIKAIGSSELFSANRQTIAERINTISPGQSSLLPRIMFVISTRTGGTPQTNLDLMQGVANFYDCYVLACNTRQIEVMIAEDNAYKVIETFTLNDSIKFASHKSTDYDEIVRSILVQYDIDLLHIRHIAWHSLNLPKLAKELEIPVVNSFHDFYTICPSVNLIDANGIYTPSGVITNGFNPLWNDKTVLSDSWAEEDLVCWREKMANALAFSDVFVTTCHSAKHIIIDALPVLNDEKKRFEVIGHGRDFADFMVSTNYPSKSVALRVLLPGNVSMSKGAALIKEIKTLDTLGQIEFHVLGACDESLNDVVIQHGKYERAEFFEKVQTIAPHIGGIFSIWPETYCHTLTECWVAGLPVIGIAYGAVEERLNESGAGWLCNATAEGIYQQLLEIKAGKDWQGKIERVNIWQNNAGTSNSIQRMSLDYSAIYSDLLNENEIKHTAAGLVSSSLTGFIMKGCFPNVPPTAFVRLVDWTSWFEEHYKTNVVYVTWSQFLSDACSKYKRIVVQRDAIPKEYVVPILNKVKKYNIELIFEIDDNLIAVPSEIDIDQFYKAYRESFKLIMKASSQVFVTNEDLKVALASFNQNIAVRPNKINPQRWLRTENSQETQLDLPGSDLNILYFGSRTHQEDLEFIVEAVIKAREFGRNIHMYIVGVGEHTLINGEFLHRLQPPSSRYDLFVEWLVSIANNFDLGVCPLVDEQFGKTKSYVKCLENLALGLPVICSDIKPYNELKTTSLANDIVFLENQCQVWCEFLVNFERGGQVQPLAREFLI